jgi:rhomboid family GlyGly-CTERM serine protease
VAALESAFCAASFSSGGLMQQRAAEPVSPAWALMCALFAVACIVIWLLPVDTQIALHWRADRWLSQPWTLWTASIVHLSNTHLTLNLLALLCLAIMGSQTGCGRDEVVALLLAWPLSTWALLIWPQLQFYAGFSGLNHALALMIAAHAAMAWIVRQEFSVIACLLGLLLLAKMLWERPWSEPLRADASFSFSVVQAAHLTGMLAALLAVALVYVARMFFTKAVVE